MSTIWIIAVCLGGAGYLALLLPGIFGLLNLTRNPPSRTVKTPFVSVIIAARNEECVIASTIDGLRNQDYPTDHYEIIIVDDRSEDRTSEIVERIKSDSPTVKLIHQSIIDPELSPKKQALDRGIQNAKGEIIITTDADCQHRPQWIRKLTNLISDEVGIVIGQARFETEDKSPLWQKFQALDFQAMNVLSAGLAEAGFPVTCSGASLAFRRTMFNEVEGWKGVDRMISGDDELLLAKASRTRWKIAVATGIDAIVNTRSPATLKDLWHQRVRWGSKGLYYRPSRKIILAGVFLFYLCLMALPVLAVFKLVDLLWFGLWAGKVILDLFVLTIGCELFEDRFSSLHFAIMELLHPPIIATLAIAGSFSSFEWKGQRFRSHEVLDE